MLALCPFFVVSLAFPANEPATREFNLPSDLAVRSFSLFSAQSGRGLIADAELIKGITTNAVRGQYTVHEVLDRALAGTGLVAKEDPKNGAFVIHREKPRPNGQRAALTTASARPQNQARPAPVTGINTGTEPVGEISGRQSGTISGRVSNQATNAYLEGAEVVLNLSGMSTLTSRDGRYSFSQVPAGTYTLSVSYAGLDPQTISTSVEAGHTAVRDANLTSHVYRLDAFVVPGEREGNASAITQQRNASNVKNVLSSDAFGNVADENLGNLLQRVPGVAGAVEEGQVVYVKIRGVDPSLNSVTVDGSRAPSGGTRAGLNRSFEISTIPADFVDKIEVIKAATPDMDADSIGGSVNLKTKSALDHKGRLFTSRVGNSYATARKTFRPMASFMYSDILGKDQNLGVMVTANYSWQSNARDVNFGAWEPTLATDRPAYFTLTNAGEDYFEQKRGGLGVRFDYRVSENSTFKLNLMYSLNHDRLFRRRNTFTGASATTILPGWTEFVVDTRNLTYGLQQVDRWRGSKTLNVRLGGEQRFSGATLDYDFNFAPSTGYEKRTNITPQVAGVGFRFDRRPLMDDPAAATFQQISGPDILNPANLAFSSLGFSDDKKEDRIFGGQANLRKTLAVGAQSYLQAGFRFRNERPKLVSRPISYAYVGPGGTQLARFVDQYYTYQPSALRGFMPSVRFFHIPTVVYEWQTKPEYFTTNEVTTLRQRLVGDRNASESVYAAYVMGHTKLGALSILAGLRVEETHVNGSGTFQSISAAEKTRRTAWVGTVTPEENLRRTQAEYGNRVTNTATYGNVFPGLHFRYEFRRGLQARASYSTGIGRPSFDTIIPNNAANDTTQIVTANNTSLKPQRSDNLDFSLEYYINPAGVVSAGIFQKKIRDFIFASDMGVIGPGVENGFNGEYAGYLLRSQSNGGSARIRGLEVNYQQQFSNLPGFWRGFGFFANATWLETKGDYRTPGVTVNEVVGFVPRSGNWGLTYIDYGWTIRVQENFTGRALNSFNANPALQLYDYGKRKVDLSVSRRINSKFTVFVDVINILGDELGLSPYVYIPGRARGADRFSPEIKSGISARF
ncbi:MAG: hypothetical protein RL077_693 [Verrucomicrobiota bacterium]|jgi:TonB-dependent receptor